ncbi:hypothetical protein SS50377_22464 [Spironucleus salmonicida]|uniref:Uncharacterized protein n=1 Tax=Spironucleus salmonicida TaxID=348837 RepID=V6LC13_9EUKA|nr:hypothetical protein SS50377_22464 [Spironucleus salmonicida]|eukprot:EST42045.1 Hypothetical protein SS50377_18352 [Spironucleus salmonicida]
MQRYAQRPPFVVEVQTRARPNLTPEMPKLEQISPYKRDATQITLRDLDMRSRSLSTSQNVSLIQSFKKNAPINDKIYKKEEIDGFKYWQDKINKLKQPISHKKDSWVDFVPKKGHYQ